MRDFNKPWINTLILFIVIFSCVGLGQTTADFPKQDAEFTFIVTADMREYAGPRYQTAQYFLGTCEAIREVGKGAFMISPGDIDPPWHVRATIDKILGADYLWYPVVGNHEAETKKDMTWLRNWGQSNIPNLVRRGPPNCEETTYSFDYGNAHFIVINQYYDGKSDIGANGDITDVLYHWLKSDLGANKNPLVFIFGHEPIIPIPDIDNGRLRHVGDSLDGHPHNSHRFQQLLREYRVKAYFCGHTHNTSYAYINGLWQLDAGHCRGLGDKEAASTFLKVWVKDTQCLVEFYRDDANGGEYNLVHSVILY